MYKTFIIIAINIHLIYYKMHIIYFSTQHLNTNLIYF